MEVKERIQQYIDVKRISINSFENSINASNGYWRKTKSISANVVSDILRIYSDINPVWVMTGEGEMIKNISENSQNLSKQSIPKERNNSIDEFINQKIEKTVMENIPAIISAVMEGMNKQMEGQNQVINKQLDMLQEVIRSLADLNNKSDKIHDNILKISRKAQ